METQTKKTKKIKTKTSSSMMERKIQVASMAAIPLFLVFLFSYLPMIGIIIVFKDYNYRDGLFFSPWIGFKNFEFFFKSDIFLRLIRNTVGMNLLFIALNLVTSVGLAVLLYNLKSKLATKIYQTIYITPNFVSWVVGSYILYGFLNPNYGILNSFLENIGIEAISWYSEPGWWPLIFCISYVWKGVGMGCIIYYAALMGIDESLFEAAALDGANKWQIVWNIMVPSIVPIMVLRVILAIGGIFRADFGMFYQLPRNIGILYPTTDVMDTYIFRALRELNDFGMSSAAGLLQSIVGFAMVMITNACAKKYDKDLAMF